jgi:hypothetical protein
MAKGQKRSNREAMKPKASEGGAKKKVPKYMESSGASGQTSSLFKVDTKKWGK